MALISEELKGVFEATETLLESIGYEIEAETMSEYLEGIEQILENEDLSEEEREQLEQFFKKLGKFAGTTARIVTAPIRGVKKVAGAVKSGVQKVSGAVQKAAGDFGAGYAAGRHGGSEPKPVKQQKPGVVSAFKAGYHGALGKAQQDKAAAQAQPATPPERKAQAAPAQVSPQAKKQMVRKAVVQAARELKAKTAKKPTGKKPTRLPAAVKGVRAGVQPNIPSAALAGFTAGQKRAAGEAIEVGTDSLTGLCEDRRRWVERAIGTPVAPELMLEGK